MTETSVRDIHPRTVSVSLRLPYDYWARLTGMARDDHRSTAAMAGLLLERAIDSLAGQGDYLQAAISWISDGDIQAHMSKHQHDANADALWEQVENQVSPQVRNQVSPQVRNQVGDQVEAAFHG